MRPEPIRRSGRHSARAAVAILLVLAGTIAGCSTGPAASAAPADGASHVPAASHAPGAPSASAPPSTGSQGGRGSIMQVNIRSGRDEGSHYAFSQQPTCTYGVAGDGNEKDDSWGTEYSGGAPDLSALTVVVPRGTEAKAGDGSRAFRFNASVNGTTYEIQSGIGGEPARGFARVVDFGSTAAITIDARTADGTRIDATIQCNVVLGPDGQPRR